MGENPVFAGNPLRYQTLNFGVGDLSRANRRTGASLRIFPSRTPTKTSLVGFFSRRKTKAPRILHDQITTNETSVLSTVDIHKKKLNVNNPMKQLTDPKPAGPGTISHSDAPQCCWQQKHSRKPGESAPHMYVYKYMLLYCNIL